VVTHQPKQRLNGVAIIALSSLFFGLMAVTTRLLAGTVPSAQIVTVRFTIGAVACLGFFLARGTGPQLKQWKLLLGRGVFGGLAVLTYFFAIERLGAAAATVLNYSSPIYAAFFAAWFLGEQSTWLKRAGLLAATIGSALVTFSSAPLTSFVPDLGALAGVASAVVGGAAMTSIRKLRDDTDAVTIFFAFCVVGALISAPVAAPMWVPLEGRALWLCLAVGVLSIGGQLLFTWGMGFTTATMGSATTQLVPAVAWVLSVAWLSEPLTALGTVGALCCVTGVLIGVVQFPMLSRSAQS
jgi:drug/metabolite transporter (DMT)-like permease